MQLNVDEKEIAALVLAVKATLDRINQLLDRILGPSADTPTNDKANPLP